MIKVRSVVTQPGKETKLQELSQCAYDILQIVKTIIDIPGEYKELQTIYYELSVNLHTQMEVEKFNFIDKSYVLPYDLLYLPYREEKDKKVLYKAEKNLRRLIFKIEDRRSNLVGKIYNPKTGIKNTQLISLLKNIRLGEKHSVQLQDVDDNEETWDEEISIDNTATPDENSGITSRIENNERILIKGLEKISIGKIKNGPNKLWESLSPVGMEKQIEAIFNITTPENGKFSFIKRRNMNIEEKKEILKDRFKELQVFTKKIKVKLAIRFNNARGTVFLNIK